MRPGQNKRRGRNPNNPNNPNGPNNRPRGPHRIQTFDSSGPNVKIRGNAYQVFERYIALAREAQSSGDRIAAENLYQHAEHYFRVMNANGEGQGQHGGPRPMTPADTEMNGPDSELLEQHAQPYHPAPPQHQPQAQAPQPQQHQAPMQPETAPPPSEPPSEPVAG
ncbi:MAG: DUF4167 domain-containing protein [Alphaproteobacteria bacterium]|nr:DUF4167 domain-containing protein [Alphaproteobacteria bacterium]